MTEQELLDRIAALEAELAHKTELLLTFLLYEEMEQIQQIANISEGVIREDSTGDM